MHEFCMHHIPACMGTSTEKVTWVSLSAHAQFSSPPPVAPPPVYHRVNISHYFFGEF
jgi:hypothetical protein